MAGKVRERVVIFLRENPQQWWSANEIIERIGCGTSGLFREMSDLGLLYRRSRGGTSSFEFQLKEIVDHNALLPEMGVLDTDALLKKFRGDLDSSLQSLQDRISYYEQQNVLLTGQITDLAEMGRKVSTLEGIKEKLEAVMRKNLALQEERDRTLHNTLAQIKARLPKYLADKKKK